MGTCKRVEIDDFAIRDLRQSVPLGWFNRVLNLHPRDRLGHSTIKITERYAHLLLKTLFGKR